MFSHIMIGSNNIERSKKFYDAVFTAIGGPATEVAPNGRLYYIYQGGRFIVTTPIDGQPATIANGATIGFEIASTAHVDAWHIAGLAAGGVAIGDPPGWRERPTGNLYLAYLRDPDGHKLCALHRA